MYMTRIYADLSRCERPSSQGSRSLGYRGRPMPTIVPAANPDQHVVGKENIKAILANIGEQRYR